MLCICVGISSLSGATKQNTILDCFELGHSTTLVCANMQMHITQPQFVQTSRWPLHNAISCRHKDVNCTTLFRADTLIAHNIKVQQEFATRHFKMRNEEYQTIGCIYDCTDIVIIFFFIQPPDNHFSHYYYFEDATGNKRVAKV